MKRTYNINLVDGHLLISDNGNTILVDTGSPITVHSKTNLSFMDRDFKVHTSIMGNGISDLSSLVGISFTTLLGMDILSQYRVVFDGVIGYDFFQSFRVMLDFKKDSVSITC